MAKETQPAQGKLPAKLFQVKTATAAERKNIIIISKCNKILLDWLGRNENEMQMENRSLHARNVQRSRIAFHFIIFFSFSSSSSFSSPTLCVLYVHADEHIFIEIDIVLTSFRCVCVNSNFQASPSRVFINFVHVFSKWRQKTTHNETENCFYLLGKNSSTSSLNPTDLLTGWLNVKRCRDDKKFYGAVRRLCACVENERKKI